MKRVIFLLSFVAALLTGSALSASAADVMALTATDDGADSESLKPKIEYVRVDSITHDPSGYFNILHYTARWRGDNWFGVGVGECYEGMLTLVIQINFRDYSEYAFEEDGVTYYEVSRDTGIISPDCYAYIDFMVQNKWGSDEYEIELLPGGILSVTELPGETVAGDDMLEVYDCGGRRIGSFTSREEIKAEAPKGLLIIRRLRGNTVVSTEKFLNR